MQKGHNLSYTNYYQLQQHKLVLKINNYVFSGYDLNAS